jgi:RNA polymerase sigma-70 factor (ECF subfamily)
MPSSSALNSEQLLDSARNGAEESRGRLLQLYANYLKLLATTQIDGKLRARVSPSDVVQDTLLEAHRDFAQFRGQSAGEFLGWLRKILVNNLARSVERHVIAEKRDVRREVAIDEFGAAFERSTARLEAVLADNATSPSAAVQRHEHLLLLADQLAMLPEDHRKVLVLRHLKELPFNEVAQQMGRSPGAVRMLWVRAIDGLRSRLREQGLT